MSITISSVQTDLNSYIQDSSTDRVSSAERFSALTESCYRIKEELDNDHSVNTYSVNYFDGAHYYKTTTAISDLLEGNDLRRAIGENFNTFSRKASSEIVEDIAQESDESAFSIERRDGNSYLVINHASKYPGTLVGTFESATADGGEWQIDTTNSDAINLDFNSISTTQGTNSLVIDADVSQSGNNRLTVYNDTFDAADFSDDKDVSSWLLDVSFPSVTYISSVTFYWGSDSSNYWSVTSTTDMNSNAPIADFNTFKFAWLNATQTGTPDETALTYIRIDINYTASQADATSFRIDNLRLVRPEKLTFYYTSTNVGTDTNGTAIKVFGATTDVPYYSGQYDGYRYAHAHMAASIIFRNLRLKDKADEQEIEAMKQISKLKKIIPKSRTPETRSFKPLGINLRKTSRFRRGR